MQQNLTLLITITGALVAAFAGGLIARRFKLPAIAGYLLAGVAIGPATPGFVGDISDISQLAEMGVIFMMFGVGLHFSIRDLMAVRRIAVPGALLQMAAGTLMGMGVGRLLGWDPAASLVLGLAITIASTVVLIRGLSDSGNANTTAGKVATGWIILEDLATIAILVLMPLLFGSEAARAGGLAGVAAALGGVAAFTGIMLLVGARVLPWLLMRIVLTRSRELFILAVVALALGIALGAAYFFGVSLALGAFLAGVVIRGSDAGHQVAAEVVPFRDIFSILFFVSVGMLVDPRTIASDPWPVLVLSAAIVGGKWLINVVIGTLLPASAATTLVVAAGLSQIGEFSFLVGQAGLSLGVITEEQYALILAGAVVSIVVNPFVTRTTPAIERALSRAPFIWRRLERRLDEPDDLPHGLIKHVVVIGAARIGGQVLRVLDRLGVQSLVVEMDPERVQELQREGRKVLFGDASNSEILNHASMPGARAIVVTVPSGVTAELIVAAAHHIAPDVPIISRAATADNVGRLLDLGAHHVVHPELEGGLEIVRHTLLELGYPPDRIQAYSDDVRGHAYQTEEREGLSARSLDQLVRAAKGVEIQWHPVNPESEVCETCLRDSHVREITGASVIAIQREGRIIANPKSDMVIRTGDVIGLIGSSECLSAAARLLDPPAPG